VTEVLRVRSLSVDLDGVPVVAGVSFSLAAGERLGLIGESGSGKSVTALAIMGLLPEGMGAKGRVELAGEDLASMGERRRSAIRGDRMAMVFQEPMTALNPLMRAGRQVAEVLRIHRGLSRREAAGCALGLLRRVELDDPATVARSYPHELSGGQRQRVMLAMAVACSPQVLVADEPTTALDVVVQDQVLSLIRRLADEEGSAFLLISHDLAVVAQMCERVLVMYGGRLVEGGPAGEILSGPRHPYTAGLLATSAAVSAPSGAGPSGALPTLPGSVPPLGRFPSGCVFRDRCWRADRSCEAVPKLTGQGHEVACWHPLEKRAG
jgi:peptide/nickel transport system ATP-binding protein